MNISFEDFTKLDIRIGRITSAEKVEGSEKLLKLVVDFGSSTSHSTLRDEPSGLDSKSSGSEREKRQIISGIAQFYAPDELIGKECPFIVNLEPRTIMGFESQGMVLAADPGDDSAVLLHPDKEISPGSKVR